MLITDEEFNEEVANFLQRLALKAVGVDTTTIEYDWVDEHEYASTLESVEGFLSYLKNAHGQGE